MSNCCSTLTPLQQSRRMSVAELMTAQMDLDAVMQASSGPVSTCQYQVAILDELAEFIGSDSLSWKWWGAAKDPDLLDTHNLKIELTDICHFHLSMMYSVVKQTLSAAGECDVTDFSQFSNWYVGSDAGGAPVASLVTAPNTLSHCEFIRLASTLLSQSYQDIYELIGTLQTLAANIGSIERFSAYMAAKNTLNHYRTAQFNGQGYTKINVEGVEDNARMLPLIEAFMDTPTMTLDELRDNVRDEFYTQE
ncbi:MAG: hypothetical protein CMF22_12155 [Idiomarinaceae bacterium]|nr:hypothetical protein [Idiomarinaceae bacterium]